MITLIEARTPQGGLLSLSLEDVYSGIIVEDVEGLGPVKATIVSSNFSTMDGAQYQSSRREARNIVIKLELKPDFLLDSVSDLRDKLYGFFMPKTQVSLRFHKSNGLVVDISGRVESCEAPLFTSEPKVNVSIICFDPDFLSIAPVELSGSSVAANVDTLVDYDGTVETGLIFVMNVDRSLTEFTLYNRPPDDIVRKLDIAASLLAGDILTISTISGAKHITLTRSGVNSSLLYAMPSQSNWLEFFPGNNYFRAQAEGAAVPYEISYITRYGGL
jgi:hypothetical protein